MVMEKPFVIDNSAKISAQARDLLLRGYEKDPAKRLSMVGYVEHEAFQPFHQKYSKFLGKRKATQKSKYVPKINKKLFTELMNFRNNSLDYSLLSKLAVDNGMNKVIAFYLLKKNIQNLSLLVLSFKQKHLPQSFPFNKLNVNDESWAEFIDFKES